LRGIKRNLYEGGIRVPLIAWSTRHIPSGTTDRPTPLTDLLPTLADLAGAPAPTDVDGLSMAPLLRGATHAARHDSLYFYRNHDGITPLSDAWTAPRLTLHAPTGRRIHALTPVTAPRLNAATTSPPARRRSVGEPRPPPRPSSAARRRTTRTARSPTRPPSGSSPARHKTGLNPVNSSAEW
jgi:hypothetical protein